VTWEAAEIVSVDFLEDGPADPLVFPGFVDLQVYEPATVAGQGVTGYLLATRRVQEAADPLCLGLHLEGPFLNPDAAGAIPVEELTPVDLAALEEWLASGLVRITTLAALNAGARFATHLWNAMAPVRARSTGPIPTLLLDRRVVLGLIADGRHLHPRTEELTVRVAGPERIALTSDLVASPGHRSDGSLLGGDRCGAALVARMARFGLAEAAAMASLTPARVLGLTDRGRLAAGFRADLAVLARDFTPLRTVVAGVDVEPVR
jgi:N-acetylglucosamine-6-phosphate deacetylase